MVALQVLDQQGNLLAPEIVYDQMQFQLLELNFTELLRKEFEEQRGLKH